MRSRYSAYVRADTPYLLATWHGSTRPSSLEHGVGCKWLGFTVKAHRQTGADSAEGEFVARYWVGGGSAQRLAERSRFVREQGRWFYLDGVIA